MCISKTHHKCVCFKIPTDHKKNNSITTHLKWQKQNNITVYFIKMYKMMHEHILIYKKSEIYHRCMQIFWFISVTRNLLNLFLLTIVQVPYSQMNVLITDIPVHIHVKNVKNYKLNINILYNNNPLILNTCSFISIKSVSFCSP